MLSFTLQVNFPVEDVEKNFRYFLGLVKRATGNVRDTNPPPGKAGPKPGMSAVCCTGNQFLILARLVNAITKVMLSTRHGPGIRITDY